MTTTLEAIHRDPAILDRAISQRETLEIVAGEVTAVLFTPAANVMDEARRLMSERFAAPDWSFAMNGRMSREERNARD